MLKKRKEKKGSWTRKSSARDVRLRYSVELCDQRNGKEMNEWHVKVIRVRRLLRGGAV